MPNRFRTAFEVLLFGTDRPVTNPQHSHIGEKDRVESIASTATPDKDVRSVVREHAWDDGSNGADSERTKGEDFPAPVRSNSISTINSLTALFDKFTGRSAEPRSPWSPSILQLRPLTGLAALGISVCCVFAALAILVISDGQAENSWTVKPSVYLAIVAALSNTALIYARYRGTPSSWWYHLSRGGTARSLQRHWQVTNSLSGALLNARRFSLLHLACIATSFVMIDGPLLQRASIVVPTETTSNVTLDLVLPPELPTGFSGYAVNHIEFDTHQAARLTLDWLNNVPMNLSAPACKGSCKATVQAPGVTQRNCTTRSWPITQEMTHSPNATWGPWKGYTTDLGPGGTVLLPAFQVSLISPQSYEEPDRELVWLLVGRINWVNLTGSYTQTTCAFAPAVMEYDVVIEDNVINLVGDQQGRFVRLANNTKPTNLELFHKKQPTTLAAFTFFLPVFVNSNASVALNAHADAASFYSPDPSSYNEMTFRHINWTAGSRDLNYVDPTPEVISKYNSMMFRGAVMSATNPGVGKLIDPDESIYQTVVAQESIHQNTFQTDLRWYAGAAAIELLTALLILPMFWGWWTLGRKATFSPFEIALAFDAPLFADVNSAAGSNGVVAELGDMKIRYGVVHQGEPTGFVPGHTESPDVVNGRLGISTSVNVTSPRKGTRFRL